MGNQAEMTFLLPECPPGDRPSAIRQAILGDWHTCAISLRPPSPSEAKERAEWDAWVGSEVSTRLTLPMTAILSLTRARV